ncbi:hypothetical protein C8R43DRAFT_261496 [Mycena crocata]|nr:hypothetical protein C8R43DRAFT_261496 [Mycena crocata]
MQQITTGWQPVDPSREVAARTQLVRFLPSSPPPQYSPACKAASNVQRGEALVPSAPRWGSCLGSGNATIDDADSSVRQVSPGPQVAGAGLGLDIGRLSDVGVTALFQIPGITNAQLEFDFTSDSPAGALYLFFARGPNDTGTAEFFLDDVTVGTFDSGSVRPDTYNISAHTNTSIPAGNHTVGMRSSEGTVVFDYAIVNPEAIPSSSPPAIASSSAATSTGPVFSKTAMARATTSPSPPPSNTAQKKVPVGAIVGGCVGGITDILAFLVGLLLCRRGRRRQGTTSPAMEQTVPPIVVSQATPNESPLPTR